MFYSNLYKGIQQLKANANVYAVITSHAAFELLGLLNIIKEFLNFSI